MILARLLAVWCTCKATNSYFAMFRACFPNFVNDL